MRKEEQRQADLRAWQRAQDESEARLLAAKYVYEKTMQGMMASHFDMVTDTFDELKAKMRNFEDRIEKSLNDEREDRIQMVAML